SYYLTSYKYNTKINYHIYWIDDLYKVDEKYGTMEDLKRLVDEAHKRDMKVILELVTNYVSETHPIVAEPEKEDWLDEDKAKPVDDYPWLENVVSLNQENT